MLSRDLFLYESALMTVVHEEPARILSSAASSTFSPDSKIPIVYRTAAFAFQTHYLYLNDFISLSDRFYFQSDYIDFLAHEQSIGYFRPNILIPIDALFCSFLKLFDSQPITGSYITHNGQHYKSPFLPSFLLFDFFGIDRKSPNFHSFCSEAIHFVDRTWDLIDDSNSVCGTPFMQSK